MLTAARQAPPTLPNPIEGKPTPFDQRKPIGIDLPSIRQPRNTLRLFDVGFMSANAVF
jgi:hypothetical protein